MKRSVLWFATFALSFLLVPMVFAEELKVGAGAAPFENVLKPVRSYFEKATSITLNVVNSGPKNAMVDLERGVLDAAAAGLSFDQWVELMKKEGAPVKDPGALKSFQIGTDRIVILTHKDNPVKSLNREQIQGIFTGTIGNWKDVGGKDAPILVVWGTMIQGTNAFFSSKMLDGKPVLKDVLEATTANEIKNAVMANPEAIGIGPVAIIDNTVGAPAIPEISRPITLVCKGNPTASLQKLLDFIKGEGQQYVKK